MNIRAASENDRDGICKLADEINMDHFNNMPRYFSKPKNDGSDWCHWKESFEKENRFAFVCTNEEVVVGFVTAQIINTPELPFLNPMKRCLIGTIVVSGNYQRKGVGSRLISRVSEAAKERRAIDLGLEVMAFNSGAREFYKNLGFACFSERLSKSLA